METPPHSRLASGVLAVGGFALTFVAFGLTFAGTNSLQLEGEWHDYYENANGWLVSTARMSLDEAALWICGITAATIAILFYRGLRRSRRAAALWGCVVGSLCLVASAIHAVWIWQKFVGLPTDASMHPYLIACSLQPLLSVPMLFAIGAGTMLSALHFREDREVEEDRAIRKAYAVSPRAGFLASLSREASGFRPALQLLLGVPAFFIILVWLLFEFLMTPTVDEGYLTVAIRENPDAQTDPDDTITLLFGEAGLRGFNSHASMTREESVIKVRELATYLVSQHGHNARIILVPDVETKIEQIIEMMDAASAGGVERLEINTAPAPPAP